MKWRFHLLIPLFSCLFFSCGSSVNNQSNLNLQSTATSSVNTPFEPWAAGMLDIHHIHTGRGDAAFMIFPDGTSMLFDAGAARQRTTKPYYPLYPSDSLSAGAWLAHYINQVNQKTDIDYAVISHFHADHYGHIDSATTWSKTGEYQLSGITELGDLIPIRNMLDRGYPQYDYPYPLLNSGKITLDNYYAFIRAHEKAGTMKAQAIRPGVKNQIVLLQHPESYPEFEVRNVKSNEWLWMGQGDHLVQYEFNPPLVNTEGYYSENPLSIGLKVAYGDFDYFTGGDLSGVDDYPDYDIETPLAEIMGEVDALTLNHHGYHDATNSRFLKKLDPQIAVHQAIHDPHFQENVLTNIASQEIEAFAIQRGGHIEEKLQALIDQSYLSTQGHVVIRVNPGGSDFNIIILDYGSSYELTVKEKFGPYQSR